MSEERNGFLIESMHFCILLFFENTISVVEFRGEKELRV